VVVGVDAHKSTSQITVMDESGNVLKRQRVPSSPAGFQQGLSGFDQPMKAVLEASYCWGPMFDWLDELADEVVLAHPSKVRAIAEARIKTDKIDSETLAHLLRADLIPRAYAPSKDTRAIKRVLRQRLFLVQLRTMVKNRIRALLAQHTVELPKLSDLFGKSGLNWLRQVELSGPDGCLLREDLQLLQVFSEKIASTESLIERLARGDEAVVWLSSLPGIGKFLSVVLRWEVDNIERFREAKKFASYTGLVPSTYSSGVSRNEATNGCAGLLSKPLLLRCAVPPTCARNIFESKSAVERKTHERRSPGSLRNWHGRSGPSIVAMKSAEARQRGPRLPLITSWA
jgi:transposase